MIHAHAKINIGLLIFEQRPDGYHSIETIFHRIALADEIELMPSGNISVSTDTADVPSGPGHLCYRAAELLQQHLRVRSGAQITLRKRIPVGAGLGGGSSDAAAILLHLPGLWGTPIANASRFELALQLGSDVPYFLGSGSAFAHGRGETLEYFTLDLPYAVLLCYPNLHVSTAWAYREVKVRPRSGAVDLRTELQRGLQQPASLSGRLPNDFEPFVTSAHPDILQIKNAMLHGGASFASMSGSGSSVYGFFERTADVRAVETTLREHGYFTSVTPPGFRTP